MMPVMVKSSDCQTRKESLERSNHNGSICQFGKQTISNRPEPNRIPIVCKKIPNSDQEKCEAVEDPILIYLVCKSLVPSAGEIRKAMEAILKGDVEDIVQIQMAHSNITEITREIFNFNKLAGTKILNLNNNRISKLPEDLFNSSIFLTLEELNLSFNRIQYLSSNQFVNLQKLRNLDLSYNEISQLESEVFKSIPTQDLQYLDIGVNKLTTLPDGLFDGIALKSLRTLSLRGNHLSQVPTCVFNSSFLTNLTNLSLFGNFIEEISLNSSLVNSKLENLEYLYIGFNEIRDILPFSLLLSSFNWIFLKVLSLEGNYISHLPPNLFHDTFLMSLEGVSFEDNLLETLPSGLFHDSMLTEIIFINFARNQINTLPPDLFNASNLRNLQQINLNNNRISHLPYHLLDSPVLQNLLYLDFSDNQISHIPPRFFRNLHKLKIIKLNNNNIKQMSEDMFSNRLEQLQILDLSYNMISTLGRVISTILSSKEKEPMLNVSYNSLTEIESIIMRKQKYLFDLFNLDVSFNNISKFEVLSTDNSPYKYNKPSTQECIVLKILLGKFVVNTTGNRIFSVDNLVKAHMALYLKNIDWTSPLQIEPCQVIVLHAYLTTFPFWYNCNCDMVSYLMLQNSKSFKESVEVYKRFFKLLSSKYIKMVGSILSDNDFSSLQCESPSHLSGKYLNEIHPDQLQCQNSDCTNVSKCSCIHTPYNSTLRINCAGLNITKIPDITENSSHLEIYMGFNQINRFPILNISRRVNILDLSYNMIRNIPMEFFLHYTNIRNLNLAGNLLLSLPVIAEWDVLNSLSTVEFRENHFLCNCSGLTLKNTLVSLNKKVVIADIEQIQCYTPGNLRHSIIYDLSDSKFGCPFLNKTLIISLSLSLSLGFIIIAFVCYAFREYIKLFLFIHFGWRFFYSYSKEKTLYDVFISYSSEDHDWVIERLMNPLEGVNPPYNLCLHERDFQVGVPICDNITKAIEGSKCTVVVVSRNWLQSDWCQFEFRVAHCLASVEKQSRLLVVLKEKIPNEEITGDLELYIKTFTYLSSDNPLFLSRLFHDLPKPDVQDHQV